MPLQPGEFDPTTQFQGRPRWSADELKKFSELARNLTYQRAHDKLGRLKLRKNVKGQLLGEGDKVLELPAKLRDYLNYIEGAGGPLRQALGLFPLQGSGLGIPAMESRVQSVRELLKRANQGDVVATKLIHELQMPFDITPVPASPQYTDEAKSRLNEALLARYNQEAQQYNQSIPPVSAAAAAPGDGGAAAAPGPRYSPEEIKALNEELLAAGAQPVEEAIPYQTYKEATGADRFEGLSDRQKMLMDEAQVLNTSNPETRERLLQSLNTGVHPYQKRFEEYSKEAEEGLQRRLKNEIDPRFISSGSWRSGKRQTAHEKARSDLEKHLAGVGAKMESEEQHKYADRQAQALRDFANFEQQETKNRMVNFDIKQQLADREQRLGQQARDFDYEEYARARAHPYEQLQRAVNLSAGYQQNVPTVTDVLRAGTHPSASQPGMSSVLGGMAMTAVPMLARLGQGQPQQAFADGGAVGAVRQKLNQKVAREHSPMFGDLFKNVPMEMSQPMPTDAEMPMLNTPEIARHREQAQNLRGAPKANLWDYIGGVGAGMLGSGGKNTTEMLMAGGKGGYDAYNAALRADEAREDKITDLNAAIQNTRQLQLDREMKYRHERDQMMFNRAKESAKLSFDEKKLASEERRHGESLSGEKSELNNALKRAQIANLTGEPMLDKEGNPIPRKMTPTDKKIEGESVKNILGGIKIKKQGEDIQSLLDKSWTGPRVGGFQHFVNTEKADNIKTATSNLITEVHQSMHNIPRSGEFVKLLEATKPGIQHYESTNKQAGQTINDTGNAAITHGINNLLGLGWTPEKIEKKFGIKVDEYGNLVEGSKGAEKSIHVAHDELSEINKELAARGIQ